MFIFLKLSSLFFDVFLFFLMSNFFYWLCFFRSFSMFFFLRLSSISLMLSSICLRVSFLLGHNRRAVSPMELYLFLLYPSSARLSWLRGATRKRKSLPSRLFSIVAPSPRANGRRWKFFQSLLLLHSTPAAPHEFLGVLSTKFFYCFVCTNQQTLSCIKLL